MSAQRLSLATLVVVLAAAGGVPGANAASRALVVTDLSEPQQTLAAARVRGMLVARGFSVDLVGSVPADTSPYCCAWDVRIIEPLSLDDEAAYLAMLQSGRGVMLVGEHPICCRDRNGTVARFLGRTVGGGFVQIDDPTRISGTVVELVNQGHVISRTPTAIKEVTWDGAAAGVFMNLGNSTWLTARVDLPNIVSAVWDEGTMSNAPAGRAVGTLDMNWLLDTFGDTDNEAFLDNIAAFLCPQDVSAFTVSVNTPGPVELECPDTLDIEGEVDGVSGECAASLTGLEVIAIRVVVDGAPPVSVATTTPALPAPAPVAFTTGAIALAPGAHTIDIEAEDDRGNRASTSVAAVVSDTLDPDIDPATCTDLLIDLDSACTAEFAEMAVASDRCDATVSVVAAPALPIRFSAPGALAVGYTATDDAGNAATCARTVTARDAAAPTLVCATPTTVECAAFGGTPRTHPGVIAFLAGTSASDNCTLASLIDDAPAAFLSACAPGRATPVRFTATDASGNAADCGASLTVVDTTAPVFTSIPAPLRLECRMRGGVARTDADVVAFLAGFSGTDVCSGASTTTNDAPALLPSGCSPGRATVVTAAISDDCANRAEATQSVTVVDTTAPLITVPTPVTIECSATGGVPRASLPAQAWLTAAAGVDVCSATTLTNNAPALLPLGCGAGKSTAVEFSARDDCFNRAVKSSMVTVRDTVPPTLTVPAAKTLECSVTGGVPRSDAAVQAWLGSATGSDLCSAVALANNAPTQLAAGCGTGQPTSILFTASDACNNAASAAATLTVRDTLPPVLSVPSPVILECSAMGGVPRTSPPAATWLAAAVASDICSAASVIDDAPALFPAACGLGRTTRVQFTAEDGCAIRTQQDSSVTVRDTTAPALVVPGLLELECNGPGGVLASDPRIVAWIASASASDDCATTTVGNDAPAQFPSGCGTGHSTTVTFTAIDECGNRASAVAQVVVRDSSAPLLSVPAPLLLECNAAGGVAASDPAVQLWLAASRSVDVCDGAVIANDAPAFFLSGCPPGHDTTATFSATDNCGSRAALSSSVIVQDSTPPVIGEIAFDGTCLWPPNHDFYCIDDLASEVTAADVCDPDPARIRVESCTSSQPEDGTGTGDGHFAPDCIIRPGGTGVCVRSERDGSDPAGRRYRIVLSATDACGNAARREATVRVPHARAPHEHCRRPLHRRHP